MHTNFEEIVYSPQLVMTWASSRPTISPEARGRIRLLISHLETQSRAINRGFSQIPAAYLNCPRWKGKTGATRAIEKIARAMPIPPDLRSSDGILWRWLQPVAQLLVDDEIPCPGIMVMTIFAGRKRKACTIETFGAGFTLHAIGRLLDRSGFKADPVAAMCESHNALVALSSVEGRQFFALASAELPAGGGAFLATPHHLGSNEAPVAICKTWVSGGQTFPDQDANLAAWHTLISSGAL